MYQGRKWLPKAGWANSNAARRNCPTAPSILSRSGWANTHPAHPPVTPLCIRISAFRLDFNMFDITDVATTGVCTDSFTVTGPTGRNPSVICGVNTGQHSKSTYIPRRVKRGVTDQIRVGN